MGIASTVLTSKRVNKPELIKELLDADKRGELINVLNDPVVYQSIIKKAAPIIREFDVQYYYPFFRKVASSIRQVTGRGVIMMENCYYSNLGIPCSTPRLCMKAKKAARRSAKVVSYWPVATSCGKTGGSVQAVEMK